jgi:hypothetical protein
MKKRYLGADLHRNCFTVCARTEDGTVEVREWQIGKLKVFAETVGGNDEVAVEATGNVRLFVAALKNKTNNLLASPDAHTAVMKIVRLVYRAKFIEPIVVALFLFQAATGLCLLRRPTATIPWNRFFTFQVASGIYLVFFILGHMNSVFLFARASLGIDRGWEFATGAPSGLLKDAWNIRLVPHYLFGVFFALSHSLAGVRVILLKYGGTKILLNRLMVAGTVLSGVIAIVIIAGMCSMHISN